MLLVCLWVLNAFLASLLCTFAAFFSSVCVTCVFYIALQVRSGGENLWPIPQLKAVCGKDRRLYSSRSLNNEVMVFFQLRGSLVRRYV